MCDNHDDYNKLIKLYELAQQEEHFYIEGQVKRLAFYSGLVTAILGATVYRLFDCDRYYEVFALIIGPIVAIAVSILGICSASRYYRRGIEVVTKLAKLDQRLGLTGPNYGGSDPDHGYGAGEPLIPDAQLKSRKECGGDADFIERNKKGGDYINTRNVFVIVIIASSLLAVGLVVLGVLVVCGIADISGG